MGERRPRRRVLTQLVPAAALAALVLAGCGGGDRHAPRDVAWPAFGGTPSGERFSALDEVSAANVDRLGVAWSMEQGDRAALWETFPVVVGRTMYLTTNTGQVRAVDAATGRERWTFTPQVDLLAPGVGSQPVNRGVTVARGRVYLVTFDDQLIALAAKTGRRLWSVRVADPRSGATQNSPPAYWDGRLYVGGAGSDSGVRGFVAAYDAVRGHELWRFDTVPARGRDWMPDDPAAGGGHVWMPPTVDPRTATVYAGTGNRSPALEGAPRSGCDEWIDATIALDARSGRLRWGHSEGCGDVWDYDSGQPPLVYDARRGGRTVRVVGHANKSGDSWLLEAASGAVLARTNVLVRRSDPRPRPTRGGVEVCPGALGGISYSPAALDPRRRLLFQPTTEMCTIYRLGGQGAKGPHVQLGNGTAEPIPSPPATGAVVAIDADDGGMRWRRALPAPAVGGALATASGLVFSGCDDGFLYALDSDSGHVVWRGRIGLAFGSAPLTYRIAGVQYLAIVAGGSSTATLTGAPVGGRLVVLRLGGRPLSDPQMPSASVSQ